MYKYIDKKEFRKYIKKCRYMKNKKVIIMDRKVYDKKLFFCNCFNIRRVL